MVRPLESEFLAPGPRIALKEVTVRRLVVATALTTVGLLVPFGGLAAAAPGAATDAASPRATPDSALAAQHRRAVASAAPVVVANQLDNPRQLALTPTRGLLVGEAGRGGSACVTLPDGSEAAETCVGTTGAVSWVPVPSRQASAHSVRVVTGLLSRANRDGSNGSGPSGVSGNLLDLYVSQPEDLPAGVTVPGVDTRNFGKLLRVTMLGAKRVVADVSGYEFANNPDGQDEQSNPYAVLKLRDRVLVADAAANTILQYRNGRLSVFAVLPNVQDGSCAGIPNNAGTTGCDFVPTALAQGPDGAIYVSALTNLSPGTAQVAKLDRTTGAVLRTWKGLSAADGVAVGPDGSVYASQLFANSVVRFAPDGTRTDIPVPFPSGLAVDGPNLYVSAYSISPAGGLGIPGVDSGGQVWRIQV